MHLAITRRGKWPVNVIHRGDNSFTMMGLARTPRRIRDLAGKDDANLKRGPTGHNILWLVVKRQLGLDVLGVPTLH